MDIILIEGFVFERLLKQTEVGKLTLIGTVMLHVGLALVRWRSI